MATAPKNNGVLNIIIQEEKAFRKGSDPLTQTARGKLQNQRQRLNEKINKELMMRDGAENLFRAAENNKKLRDRVGLELAFFNSNIQVLKEQLAEMNSSVHVYQHENSTSYTPMIPLGLKETTEVKFETSLQDEILQHYSDDPEKYNTDIQELNNLRQAIRTPERSHAGVELLTEYFNQLGYLDKRFFSPRRPLHLFFHWFDSLSGVPDIQKSIGFEKGSVLYNIGALYTQLACRQDRTSREGILQALVNFEKAAGVLKYLETRFSSAPSQDMQHDTLDMLVSLMLAQSQECVLEGRLTSGGKEGVLACVQIAQEASTVSHKYQETFNKMSQNPIKTYIPYSWLTMTETKYHFYKGLSHYYVALAILEQKDSTDKSKLQMLFETMFADVQAHDENNGLKLPETQEERTNIGKAHLRESLVNHEESNRIHELCKQMRQIDTFKDILEKTHERCLNKFSSLEEEDDFSELIQVSDILPKSEHNTVAIAPELSKLKVVDIFWKLGPLNVFNANNDWSAPRTVILERSPSEGFGFSVKGDSPVMVADIEEGSVAAKSGMKVKDLIVAVGSVDSKWSKHDEVVELVRQAQLTLKLTLVTPFPKPDPPTNRPFSTISLPASPVKGFVVSQTAATERERKTQSRISAPWMFIRKNSSKDKHASTTNLPNIGHGTTKVVSNGTIKHIMNGADVEL